jgi:serine/threonine protein kinase
MASPRIVAFLEQLREADLLSPAQLNEARNHPLAQGEEPLPLAKDLIIRGWMTGFQAKQMILGRGRELVLGPYRLQELLGEGGMGQVYRAYHVPMGRTVALKVVRKEHVASPAAVQRFHQEIRAAGQLVHPNIITAFDAGEVNGTHFYAMEYVEGTDLAKLVKESGPLSPVTACEYIRQAALGLQHAHERGLVHRDIKPANLLLSKAATPDTPLGTIKLLDLGLARLQRAEQPVNPLTRLGTIVGTPQFLAPEQALNARNADIRSDLYSLGCTFFFLLTGQPPFRGEQLNELLLKHQMDEPPALDTFRTDVPPGVQGVIRKLLAKRPADRFQTPAELLAALPTVRKKMGSIPVAQVVGSVPAASVGRRGVGRRWAVAALLALPILIGIILVLALSGGGESHAKLGSAPTTDPFSSSSGRAPVETKVEQGPEGDTGLAGTWKLTMGGPGKEAPEMTLKFKREVNKLTGSIAFRDGRDWPIEDIQYRDGRLAFKLVREGKGKKWTMKYEGEVAGDTIKGKIEFDNSRQVNWEAKRVKE